MGTYFNAEISISAKTFKFYNYKRTKMMMITYGVILEEWNGTFSNCLL